jgi:hypothetical protein
MPNWCQNVVTITCDESKKEELAALLRSIEEEKFCEHVKPLPGGEWNYGWAVANWGTKWDIVECEVLQDEDTEIIVFFQSAWSPPLPIYEQLVADGFGVDASYEERGCGFCGVWRDGVDDSYDIPEFESRGEAYEWVDSLPDCLGSLFDGEDWGFSSESDDDPAPTVCCLFLLSSFFTLS